MNTSLIARLDPQILVRLLLVLAILATLVAGHATAAHLAPAVHAISSSVPAHSQMADTCPPMGTHC